MSNQTWSKGTVKIEYNNLIKDVPCILPEILSVSRSTDIPAFYSDWFINRLDEGYSVWLNPMNQKPQIIKFDNVKFIVFWTKNSKPLHVFLKKIDDKGILYYFQYTLTNYDKYGLEPNLPLLSERIITFKELSKKIGKERVIWRFDPLLLSNTITIDTLIKNIEFVGYQIHEFTEKLVISFIDITPYKKVRTNLNNAGFSDIREFTHEEMKEFGYKLSQLNRKWGLKISTCGEIIDLDEYEIEHNKCIDSELIKRICSSNSGFVKFVTDNFQKDKGQRDCCGCISSKDIGMYNTCMHQCVYCYANHFQNAVCNNYNKHLKNNNSPVINGSDVWLQHFFKDNDQKSLDFF